MSRVFPGSVWAYRLIVRVMTGSLLIGLLAGAAYAQTVSGTLNGRVTDASGGTIPSVTVLAVEEQTKTKRQTITNEAGFFQIPFTPLGQYTVTFSMPGFKTLVRPGVEVRLNNTTTLDVALEIAAQAEVITVTGDVPQIDTNTGELKTSFDAQHIQDKPVFDRNMLALAADVPGFQTNPVSGQNNPTASSGSSVQINGTGTRAATFQTDGVNNDDSSENQHRQKVNISAIKEFQVLSNSFTAEFGRGAGAVVLVQTRAGTNALHGDAYWYTRNRIFNANSFFANQGPRHPKTQKAPKPSIHRHLWGGTVGGPIIKDKLFFFQSFERIVEKGESTVSRAILLPEERSVHPDAVNLTPQDRAWIQGIIDRFPNVPPNNTSLGPRVHTAFQTRNWPEQDYSTRIDLPAKTNHHLMFRYQFSGQMFDNSDNIVRGEATRQDNRQQNFGSTYTHVFTPKTVGEFRFAIGRRRTTVNIKDGNETPIVRFNDISRGTLLGNSGVYPILRYQTDFQYVYNLTTLLTSKNSLKLGMDLRRQQLNDRADQFSRGFWTFNLSPGFNGIDNFRRGVVSRFEKSWGPNFLGNRSGELNFYLQDDWKIRRNLTINLGARLEHVLRLREVNNRLDYGFGSDTNIEPRFGFAWTPAVRQGWLHRITGDPGRFVLRGGAGFFHGRLYQSVFSQNGASVRFNPPNALSQVYTDVFPDGVRGPADPSGGFNFTPGTFPTVRYSPTLVDPHLRMPYTEQWNLTLERQFPRKISVSASYVGNRGIGLLFYDLTNRAEFPIRAADDYRVSPTNRGVMIDCIIPAPVDPDDRDDPYFRPGPGCISPAQPRNDDRRPDPRYGGVLRIFNGSWSYYHGLQLSLLKRYSHGLYINANYTWSKAIDTGSEATFTGLDSGSSASGKNSAAAMRGLSLFHQNHRMVINYSYQIPFFAQANPLLQQVLGGWQISGTTSFSSGNPFTITAGFDINADGSASDRPFLLNPGILGVSVDNARRDPATGRQISQDRIRLPNPAENRPGDIGFSPDPSTRARAFNPGLGNQGNLGRNTFFAHGQSNWDLGIYKSFRIREGHRLMVRMEFYNLFNRVQWFYPNRSILTGGFLNIESQRNGPRTGQFALRYIF